uniref:Uncharacterized protein n=1 Tax=Physcomitrium patens TaxID=3218 RepID=A0A2K1J9H9_PHYPA|nr:hypothetical protein PHYPA_021295 [Physcomitrium patens]
MSSSCGDGSGMCRACVWITVRWVHSVAVHQRSVGGVMDVDQRKAGVASDGAETMWLKLRRHFARWTRSVRGQTAKSGGKACLGRHLSVHAAVAATHSSRA